MGIAADDTIRLPVVKRRQRQVVDGIESQLGNLYNRLSGLVFIGRGIGAFTVRWHLSSSQAVSSSIIVRTYVKCTLTSARHAPLTDRSWGPRQKYADKPQGVAFAPHECIEIFVIYDL
jgi:hypothetical protein